MHILHLNGESIYLKPIATYRHEQKIKRRSITMAASHASIIQDRSTGPSDLVGPSSDVLGPFPKTSSLGVKFPRSAKVSDG
jgi:hypothetical protein